MNTTKHTTLSNQIQNIGIHVKREIKGNRSLSIAEQDFIQKFADELSLRLPINTTLYYYPNDPMNPVNDLTRDEILEWIDQEVHLPKNPNTDTLKHHHTVTPKHHHTLWQQIKANPTKAYGIALAVLVFLGMCAAINQILPP